jgi:hypothetical protein
MKRSLSICVLILAGAAAASAQSLTYYFPQIAVGGGWTTTIFMSNATAAGGAKGRISFATSAAAPFNANWVDETGNNVSGGGNVIDFQLGPGESLRRPASGQALPLRIRITTYSTSICSW